MTVLALLPQVAEDAIDVRQRVEGLSAAFGSLDRVLIVALPEHADHYRAILAGVPVVEARPRIGDGADELVTCGDVSAYLPITGPLPAVGRNWHLTDHGRLIPVGRGLDTTDCPDLFRNAFSARSPRDGLLGIGCFYYFPYGYLYRFTGLGHLNEFGHRIGVDLASLGSRPATHRVIALFGGSAAFSIFCLDHQTFAHVMQNRLNARSRAAGSELCFTVLNFGTPGAVVLNEIQTFLLFCDRIRPDIVISHSGGNDLFYAQTSDPHLLRDYGIVYQDNLEEWAERLHGEAPAPVEPAAQIGPLAPLQSYVRRIRQFATLVQGWGAAFIWGLQPVFISKAALSPKEHEWIWTRPRVGAPERERFQRVAALMDVLSNNEPDVPAAAFVNFHRLFRMHGANDTLLADVIHLHPNGDLLVGETYAGSIWDMFHRD